MTTKRVLFLSNLPTPYQLDYLGQLSRLTEVRAVFLSSHEENRNWTLQSPAWMRVLKKDDKVSKWSETLLELVDFKPSDVIVGGYRLPLANRLKWYCWRNNIHYYYWLEKPLPAGGVRALLRSLVWRMTLPFSDGVLCIGSEAVQAYGKYALRSLNLPYSIDITRYRVREPRIPEGALRCLFVGQYINRKGVRELLDAFASIQLGVAELTMVGSGDLFPLVEEFSKRNPHIHNLGFIEPKELSELFAIHDIFVLPSRHDGWAVVIAEAMAAALPVVGTLMTGAFVDLVSTNGCGRQCDVDAKSIREMIESYAQNPESVLREGLLGRKALIESRAESSNAARSLLDFIQVL